MFSPQVGIIRLGFWLLQAQPDVLTAGRDYYNALIWGAPATLLNFTILGWFLGRGAGKQVLILSVVAKGANIALDYLFIVRWGWASSGAGAATALSQYLNLSVGLLLIWRSLKYLPTLNKQLLDRSQFAAIFQLNRDITIRTLALVSTFALFTNFSSAISTNTLATNTLLLQVVTFSAYFIDGIAFATESIVGNLRGQQEYTQLRQILQLAAVSSISIGIAIACLFCLAPKILFGILTSHESVITQVTSYVWWLLPILATGAIAYMLDGYFLGLTQGKILRNSSLVATGIGFLPLGIIASLGQNNHLLWLALSSFMATRAITLVLKLDKQKMVKL